METDWIDHHSKKSLQRLLPRLDDIFDTRSGAVASHRLQALEKPLHTRCTPLFGILINLYGWRYDFYYHLRPILISTAQTWLERPGALEELDVRPINILRSIILSIGTILYTEAALQLDSFWFVWLDRSVPADTGGDR
jgi:hypothetical protein